MAVYFCLLSRVKYTDFKDSNWNRIEHTMAYSESGRLLDQKNYYFDTWSDHQFLSISNLKLRIRVASKSWWNIENPLPKKISLNNLFETFLFKTWKLKVLAPLFCRIGRNFYRSSFDYVDRSEKCAVGIVFFLFSFIKI